MVHSLSSLFTVQCESKKHWEVDFSPKSTWRKWKSYYIFAKKKKENEWKQTTHAQGKKSTHLVLALWPNTLATCGRVHVLIPTPTLQISWAGRDYPRPRKSLRPREEWQVRARLRGRKTIAPGAPWPRLPPASPGRSSPSPPRSPSSPSAPLQELPITLPARLPPFRFDLYFPRRVGGRGQGREGQRTTSPPRPRPHSTPA